MPYNKFLLNMACMLILAFLVLIGTNKIKLPFFKEKAPPVTSPRRKPILKVKK